MLNVNELENKWRKYKIKSYTPHFIITLSISLVFLLIYTLYSSKTISKEIEPMQNKETASEKQISEPKKVNSLDKNTIKTSKQENTIKHNEVTEMKKTTLSPSLDFMSNMKHNVMSSYEDNDISVSKVKKIPKRKILNKPVPEQIKLMEPEKKQIVQKSSIHIKRQDTQEDISHVIKRFKKNNNPALSLFVAKKYYELEEYDKSYNYALMTNQINDNIDASWIIFVKSLVKLNRKDEAIKTLKKYINHSHSNQAKMLLEEILSGKFK